MDWVSVTISLSLSLLLGALLIYVSLVIGCLVAIESISERRLPQIALISRIIEMMPLVIAAVVSVSLPNWTIFLSSALAVLMMIPLLGIWGGFDAAKTIYIVILASLINFVFSALILA